MRLHRLKRLFVGSPIPTAQSRHERLRKTTALAVFAGRALTHRVRPGVLRRAGAVAFAVVGILLYNHNKD